MRLSIGSADRVRSDNFAEKKAKRASIYALVLLLRALASAILPLLIPFRPRSQLLGAWWAWFGSVTTVFGLSAQVRVDELAALRTPGGYASTELVAFWRKYSLRVKWFATAPALATAAGTLIWGFGDLLI